jgi:hypothetical protein
MSNEKLTWKEFVDKYKPKSGDKFLDDRGNEWEFKNSYFETKCGVTVLYTDGFVGFMLTCPLIPLKQKRKLWPALVCGSDKRWLVTNDLYDSYEAVQTHLPHVEKIIWPAIPNADGSYEVDE